MLRDIKLFSHFLGGGGGGGVRATQKVMGKEWKSVSKMEKQRSEKIPSVLFPRSIKPNHYSKTIHFKLCYSLNTRLKGVKILVKWIYLSHSLSLSLSLSLSPSLSFTLFLSPKKISRSRSVSISLSLSLSASLPPSLSPVSISLALFLSLSISLHYISQHSADLHFSKSAVL